MINVIIVDDFPAMRFVMQRMLERAGDIRVVAQAGTFDDAVEACQEQDCDAIVLDDYLAPYDCDTAVTRLRQAGVTAPVLVTSMHVDVELAGRALISSANGFVLKTDLQEHFIAAVRALHAGEMYLSPCVAEAISYLHG